MIINYTFNNYRSFCDDAEFSMTANAGKVLKRYPDNYSTLPGGLKLLKSAVMVGENAGGKSNFIYSLQFLKSLFQDNSVVKTVSSNINSNAGKDQESFDITFCVESGRVYHYCLTIDSKRIIAESLFYKNEINKKEQSVFEAYWAPEAKAYHFEDSGIEEPVRNALRKNAGALGLFTTKLALLGNEYAIEAVNWMNNTLYPVSLTEGSLSVKQLSEQDISILNDPGYLDIFRMVDYSICGITVDREQPFSKTIISRKRADGTTMDRELQYDSTGVREFFVWAIQIFRVVYENRVVFADEMDRVLNPVLSERVISFINGKTHCGQFIFSTHNVLHLDLKTYMKEQIYFVTKIRDSLNSELYSLSDFPEVRYETTKIYEFYMKGILGGTALE
ncbi:MAG: ATP-binding protein [Lachnospiraceae bacterium]|nr:ATP-binding protein [Lachnospiraceae bacterium]